MQTELTEILRPHLPQWDVAEFVFLEDEPWWAPSVRAELSVPKVDRQPAGSAKELRCVSLTTERAVLERIDNATPAGIILFARDRLRESLLLLGRLGRLCRPTPPVLVVIPETARAMIPLLLESGADTVYTESVTDIRIAGWCRRVARR